MNPLKTIIAVILILIVTYFYGLYMVYWSVATLPIIEIIDLNITTSIVIFNLIAIIILSLFLSAPLIYLFKTNSHYVAFILSITTIIWHIVNLLTQTNIPINIINYSEWLSLLICFPVIVFYLSKKWNYSLTNRSS